MTVRNDINRMARRLLLDSPLSPSLYRLMAKVFRVTAYSGQGSDACLREGYLPVPVHFYSPIPDIADLQARNVWDVRTAMIGIDFREPAQEELLARLGAAYGGECLWPFEPPGDPAQFYLDNQSFSFGCAASTYCLIRQHQPRSVIEIGSGLSSRVISAALRRNQAERGVSGLHVIVDPYADKVLEGDAFPATEVVAQRVELLDPSFFSTLREGDVLFIDSGHSVRIGGDVNFLFLEVLPRLAPGVIVHVHDIALPFEYSKAYATTASFRQFWTEQYLLQAFLCFNREFEVMLGMNWLMVERMELVRAAFPHYDPAVHPFLSGSFWMRRVAERSV